MAENRWIISIFSLISERRKLIKFASTPLLCDVLRKRFLSMRTWRHIRVTSRTRACIYIQAEIVVMMRGDGLALILYHSAQCLIYLSFYFCFILNNHSFSKNDIHSTLIQSSSKIPSEREIKNVGSSAQWKWVWHNTSELRQPECERERHPKKMKEKKITVVNRRSGAQCSSTNVRETQIECEALDKSCCWEQNSESERERDMDSVEHRTTQQPNVKKKEISDRKFGKLKDETDWRWESKWENALSLLFIFCVSFNSNNAADETASASVGL